MTLKFKIQDVIHPHLLLYTMNYFNTPCHQMFSRALFNVWLVYYWVPPLIWLFFRENTLSILYFSIRPFVCLSAFTNGRSQLLLSGDVSNWSYRMTVHPVTSSRLSWPSHFLYAKNNNKLPRNPTFAYLTVAWTSGADGRYRGFSVTWHFDVTHACDSILEVKPVTARHVVVWCGYSQSVYLQCTCML